MNEEYIYSICVFLFLLLEEGWSAESLLLLLLLRTAEHKQNKYKSEEIFLFVVAGFQAFSKSVIFL